MTIRRAAALISVNVLILAAGVTAVEIAFGDWLGPARLNKLNITRNRRRVYDVSKLYAGPTGFAVCTRDRYGLRGAFGDPSRIDILTVGGSTTDQRFITDGQTWQDVLQNELLADGVTANVANAGVDGQSTFGHIKNFDWWFPGIPGLKPRFIVYYVGLNDFYRDERHEKDDLRRERGPSLKRLLETNSAVFHLYRTLKGMYRAEVVHELGHRFVDFDRVRWTDVPLIGGHEELIRPRLESYARRLGALCARTRELDAVPVFMTQPSRRYKRGPGGEILGVAKPFPFGGTAINGVDYFLMLRRLDETTLEVCRREGGIPVDLAGEARFEDRDFYDFNHMTPAGAAKVGHFLYEKLRPLYHAAHAWDIEASRICAETRL